MAKDLAKIYDPKEVENKTYDFWLKNNYFRAKCDKDLKPYFVPSLFLLGLFLVAFFSFSVFPPHLQLFRDETTGFYGILPEYADQSEAVLNNL